MFWYVVYVFNVIIYASTTSHNSNLTDFLPLLAESTSFYCKMLFDFEETQVNTKLITKCS